MRVIRFKELLNKLPDLPLKIPLILCVAGARRYKGWGLRGIRQHQNRAGVRRGHGHRCLRWYQSTDYKCCATCDCKSSADNE